jgi:hypothetical protein
LPRGAFSPNRRNILDERLRPSLQERAKAPIVASGG